MKLNSNILFILLSVGVLLFIYSLYQRMPHIDDAWIGEQVFWLSEDGVIKNILMKNYADNQNGLMVYHKAFVYNGLWLVNLFGFSLTVLKSVSLIYLLTFFGIFYYYLVVLHKILKPRQFPWIVLLIIIEPHIFNFAFVYRPEIMLMAIGFLAYIFLEQSILSKSKGLVLVLLASIFSGLSVLVHLNGLIFVFAGGFVLLYKKQFKYLALFVLVNTFFIYLYFSHMESFAELYNWFSHMLSYNTGRSVGGFKLATIVNILLKFVEEHLRYFHSPKEIFLTLFLFTVLFFGYKTVKRKLPLVIPYMFVLMISIGIIGPTKTAKYLIPLIPFFALIATVVVIEIWKKEKQNMIVIPKTYKAQSIFIALTVFVIVSFIYNSQLSVNKFNVNRHKAISERFVNMPKKETRILVPMVFIFDEIKNYKEIIGLMSFNERAKTNPDIMSSNFFTIAELEEIDYIFINDHYIDKFNLDISKTGAVTGNYIVVGKMDELTILELEVLDRVVLND